MNIKTILSIKYSRASLGSQTYLLVSAIALGSMIFNEIGLDNHGFYNRLFSIFFGQWISVTIILFCVLVGKKCFALLINQLDIKDRPYSILLIAGCLGYWLLELALFSMYYIQWVHGPKVMFALLLCWTVIKCIKKIAQPTNKKLSVGRWQLLIIIAIALLLIPFWLTALLPNDNWDSAGVHLPLAQQIAHYGITPITIETEPRILAGGVHLYYAWLISIGAESGIIFLNFLALLITVVAAGIFARKYWGPWAGYWSAAICISCGLVLQLGIDARIDGFLALFVTVSAYCVMLVFSGGRFSLAGLFVIAMLMGNAAGVKYLAVFPLAIMAVIVLIGSTYQIVSWKKRLKSMTVATLLFASPAMYWYGTNMLTTGDPFYPLMHGRLVNFNNGSPEYLRNKSNDLHTRNAINEDYLMPNSIRFAKVADAIPPNLLDPVSIYLEPRIHSRKLYQTLSPLLIIFLFFPLLWRDKKLMVLSGSVLLVYVAIGQQTYLLRYVLLIIPLMAVVAGAVIARYTPGWKRVGPALIASLSLIFLTIYQMNFISTKYLAEWFSGDVNRLEWLARVGYDAATSMPRAILEIRDLTANKKVAEPKKVLFVGEAKTHLFPYPAIIDTSRTGQPWMRYLIAADGDLNKVYEILRRDEVQWVCVNMDYFNWVAGNTSVNIELLKFTLQSFFKFSQIYTQPILSHDGLQFYRLKQRLSNKNING